MSHARRPHLSRRRFLADCGVGIGRIGALSLLAQSAIGGSPRPQGPHFAPRAKAVIHLFMGGAPSQLELFDNKPTLTRFEGKPLPASILGDQRYAFIRPDAAVLGPQFAFARHGQCGAELGAPLRHLAQVADELCIVRSMHTDQFNHAPAQLLLNSGFAQPGRPSMGSWAVYGLGAESKELPAFVVMSTGNGLSAGSALWSSGFLPPAHTGVRLRNGKDPILDLSTPERFAGAMQDDTFALLAQLDGRRAEALGDPAIAARIRSFEMAARLQTSAPELLDLAGEGQATLNLYGCDPGEPSFARACLLARRLVERGVRFVDVFHEGWDAHSDVKGNVSEKCEQTDRACAALVLDLKRRGMLDDTLVVWGGEFGRTPMVETNPSLGRSLGRDHHPQAFTTWMAGGGARRGHSHGATDDFGFHVVEDPVHVHDLQATILHLLGFDHERLTFRHAGRDYRLTDLSGRVVRQLLA
ncbi:MAG: DUF1501 domain-containing protein [Planctomycetes bacterium]|nr:DUF1501 domain-containing protein [Planctomycetota bacterium]